MNHVTDASKALYDLSLALAGFVPDAPVHLTVRANGRTARHVHDISFTVEFGKLIFAHWGADGAESWRVTAFAVGDGDIRLAVSRRAGAETASVTLSKDERTVIVPLGTQARRYDFAERLRGMLAEVRPGAIFGQPGTSVGDASRFRVRPVVCRRFRVGDRRGIALGLPPEEFAVDRLLDLAAGFQNEYSDVVAFVPESMAGRIAGRLAFVQLPRLNVFAYDVATGHLRRMTPAAQFELAADPFRVRWLPEPVVLSSAENARLNERFGERRRFLDVVPAIGRTTLSLHWNGLECARLRRETETASPSLAFGLATLGERTRLLNDRNLPLFIEMIELLARYRTAAARDRQHPLYRARPERWLEAMVARRISALDPELDDRYAYRQVAALGRSENGIADILGIRRDGTLAVIELKAAADGGLFWQGLEYWRRVAAHHRRGELARRGYFPEATLNDRPPFLYLVAPVLRFHGAFRAAVSTVRPDVPVRVVAVSERWREELNVVAREDF
jgi:hypothetical protein